MGMAITSILDEIPEYFTRLSEARSVGHNPLGVLSIVAMFLVLITEVATGLFNEDKGDALAPLNNFVTATTMHLATGHHKNIREGLLLIVICVVRLRA